MFKKVSSQHTGMYSCMVFVVCCTGKCPTTALHLTFVRFFTGVCSEVNFANVGSGERSLATRESTHKWSLA